jgi:hypothetical protein
VTGSPRSATTRSILPALLLRGVALAALAFAATGCIGDSVYDVYIRNDSESDVVVLFAPDHDKDGIVRAFLVPGGAYGRMGGFGDAWRGHVLVMDPDCMLLADFGFKTSAGGITISAARTVTWSESAIPAEPRLPAGSAMPHPTMTPTVRCGGEKLG